MTFSMVFLLMVNCKFANASHDLMCKYDWWKLKTMKNQPNNILVPYTSRHLMVTMN